MSVPRTSITLRSVRVKSPDALGVPPPTSSENSSSFDPVRIKYCPPNCLVVIFWFLGVVAFVSSRLFTLSAFQGEMNFTRTDAVLAPLPSLREWQLSERKTTDAPLRVNAEKRP